MTAKPSASDSSRRSRSLIGTSGSCFADSPCASRTKLPGLDAFVIDDTGFPKKGKHSVGTASVLGDDGPRRHCQVAASLHLASEAGGACIGMRPRRRTRQASPRSSPINEARARPRHARPRPR
ncbi:transposase [Pseudenhygromyxa sp. WMMC2535]|nr:transposase [Pseudenhygromyxa sp. WMMC2535]